MASYGAFIAITGFFCHGPKRRITFDSPLGKSDQKWAFINAEGWGTYSNSKGKESVEFAHNIA
jgi:hypothetical protein